MTEPIPIEPPASPDPRVAEARRSEPPASHPGEHGATLRHPGPVRVPARRSAPGMPGSPAEPADLTELALRARHMQLAAPSTDWYQPNRVNAGGDSRPIEITGVSVANDPGEVRSGGADPVSLTRFAYRIAYRLIGHSGHAATVAREAVSSAGSRPHGQAPEGEVAATVTRLALAWRFHNNSTEAVPSGDPHDAHRIRLCRELRRWPQDVRTVLAIRHLGDVSPGRTAELLGEPEHEVRSITAQWRPADRDSVGLLGELDAWVAPPDGADDHAHPLAYLDDPHATTVI